MNDPGVRTTGAVKLPDALVVISGSDGDARDAIKGAQFHSAGWISFQSEAPGVLKIGPLDHDIEMLACNGFSAASEMAPHVVFWRKRRKGAAPATTDIARAWLRRKRRRESERPEHFCEKNMCDIVVVVVLLGPPL